MAIKAATLEEIGPVMFPVYFGFDLSKTYLFFHVDFMSPEFWGLLLIREIMGLVRNIGVYDIMSWCVKRCFDSTRVFPLRDSDGIQSLITIAAVDTIAESLACVTFLFIYLGHSFANGGFSFYCLFDFYQSK